MKKFPLLKLLSLIFILTANSAWSETIPEYDGVYFRLQNGTLVQLNPINSSNEVYRVSSNENCNTRPCVIESWSSNVAKIRDGQLLAITPRRPMAINVKAVFDTRGFTKLSSLSSLPRSIVIRGASPDLKFNHELVSFAEYTSALQKGFNNPNLAFSTSFLSGKAVFPDVYVFNNWGCSPSNFKAKRLDQFTVEYVVDQCSLTASASPGPFSGTSLSRIKYVIETNLGSFGYY
jgi:hypothetical protein